MTRSAQYPPPRAGRVGWGSEELGPGPWADRGQAARRGLSAVSSSGWWPGSQAAARPGRARHRAERGALGAAGTAGVERLDVAPGERARARAEPPPPQPGAVDDRHRADQD